MNKVTDAVVAEYAARIRAGSPLGALFPARMSDCDFTEEQRLVIRKVRAERKAMQKADATKMRHDLPIVKAVQKLQPTISDLPKPEKSKSLSKLEKMLFLQSGRCFFCGGELRVEDASIEHLNPISRGGKRAEENEVVCHASLNETFGALDLKRKFEFVLRAAGKFYCPKK